MTNISTYEGRNRLLRSLSAQDFALLAPHLELINLPMKAVIEEPGKDVDFVVFLESGIGSSIVIGLNGEMAEARHIGREGMTGRSVVLGSDIAITRIVMQVPGKGWIISPNHLAAAMRDSKTLHDLMNNYVLAGDSQAAHTLLAATSFSVGQRLARWLLMYDDRIDGDDLPVTHELLAMMLSVRRPGVTDAMHILEGDRAIRSTRGHAIVLSRRLLMEAAGACYGLPEQEYERLIPALAISAAALPEEAIAS